MGTTTTLEEIVGVLGDGCPRGRYLSHGGESVWVVYPERRAIRVYDAAGGSKMFRRDEPLVDPAVLPGFSIPTSAIFEGV
jgi:hypothetical protein